MFEVHIHKSFYTHIDTYFTIDWLAFVPSNLSLHSHEIRFANVSDLFLLLIKKKTLRFKSSVLFGVHVLLSKLFTVLQLPTHLSNLTENGL